MRGIKFKFRTTARDSSVAVSVVSLAGALIIGLLLSTLSTPAQQSEHPEKKSKDLALHWDPPALESHIRAIAPTPPCDLSKVLGEAAASESEQVTNLQNFTAQEQIRYQTFDRDGMVQNLGSETFDYIVLFEKSAGGLLFQEKRDPTHGSNFTAEASQDMGLPEIVLIFLPNMQGDYDMKCEGEVEWGGQSTWVVHFLQRKDKPRRTYSFRIHDEVHPAALKGRAWIVAGTGQVVHMETGLMEPVRGVRVQQSYLSLDYAPIQFQAEGVRVWLPKLVQGYCDFGDHRTIVAHTFSDFMLFSVHTDQKIEKPKQN